MSEAGSERAAPSDAEARPRLPPAGRERQGALLSLAGIFLLTIMDVGIKHVAGLYPTFQVAMLRFWIGGVAIALVAAVIRPGWPSRETAVVNGLRSVLIALMASMFFFALATLPLAEAMALSFLSPVFLALLGRSVLGEPVGPRIGLALVAGFIGMVVIVGGKIGGSGYQDAALLGALAAFCSAFIYALSMTLLRSRATRDPIVTIVLFQNFGPALILTVPGMWVWQPVSPVDLAIFLGIGIVGAAGHLALAMAFARAPAARLAPLEYTALVWGVGLGYLIFGEIPDAATVAGALLIIASAYLTSR